MDQEIPVTKFFIDADGNYLGGFCGAEPPKGAIEVPNPPDHAWQKYANGMWLSLTSDQKQLLKIEQKHGKLHKE